MFPAAFFFFFHFLFRQSDIVTLTHDNLEKRGGGREASQSALLVNYRWGGSGVAAGAAEM